MIDALLVSAAALWVLGVVLLGRARALPAPNGAAEPRVSVIIPARDEALNLPPLLDSLAAQILPACEVFVADDGSTDGTADVARARGATVVPVNGRPTGWTGKTWACWTAARRADGELLLFLDADTRLAPDALQRIADAYRGGLLSVEPYHEVPTLREQTSAFFNLVRAASVRAFTALGDRIPAAGAFGPCLAVSRSAYFEHEGHAHPAVRGEVLEHHAMGRIFARHGHRVDCYAGRGAVSFRMYPGAGELVDGWSKGFAAGARGTPRAMLWLAVAWLAGAIQAALALFAVGVAAPAGAGNALVALAAAVYAAYALQIGWLLRRLGSFSPLTAALYPAPLLAFLAIFARSAYLLRFRGRVTWRGREVPVASKRGARS